jgi:tyrosyl-tRNA synthetase
MFKKVMEIPDDLIIRYFELATDEHPDDYRKNQARIGRREQIQEILNLD